MRCLNDLIIIKGTNVTESLGENEIRVRFLEKVEINFVNALVSLQFFRDKFVDLVTGVSMGINVAPYHHGYLSSLRWVITLVAYAHKGIT